MQIAVTFRHMETEEAAKRYVKEKVQRLQKYIENPREVHVVLSAEKFRHTAEITIVGNGMTLNSQGKNTDLYAAIDQMVDKIERQIRERREKGRRKRVTTTPPPRVLSTGDDSFEEKGSSPLIQKKHVRAKPMSLEEAVVQLETSKRDVLVFLNVESEQLNVICRSKDGGYEWIEPAVRWVKT